MEKKGASEIVTTAMLIALAVISVGIVWIVVNNIVSENVQNSEACFGIFEKVILNSRYVCYNSSSNELIFSISVEDIEIDEILLGITVGGTGKSFRIYSQEGTVEGIRRYSDSGYGSSGESIKIPEKNSGLTYILNLTHAELSGKPNNIQIAPLIEGVQCEISSSISQIENCALFDI